MNRKLVHLKNTKNIVKIRKNVFIILQSTKNCAENTRVVDRYKFKTAARHADFAIAFVFVYIGKSYDLLLQKGHKFYYKFTTLEL